MIGAPLEAVVSHWQGLGAIDESEAIDIIAKAAVTPPEEVAVEVQLQHAGYVLPKYVGTPRSEYQWEPWQKAKLLEMRDAGKSWEDIVAVVGRTVQKCRAMYHNEKKKLRQPEVTPPPETTASVQTEEPDSIRRFLERGGSITKLPTRFADGVH